MLIQWANEINICHHAGHIVGAQLDLGADPASASSYVYALRLHVHELQILHLSNGVDIPHTSQGLVRIVWFMFTDDVVNS